MRSPRDRRWIISALGDEATFQRLAHQLSGSELWSVLMELMRERARARAPAQLLSQYGRDAFVRPASVDQRTLVELDRHLLEAAHGFEAIELSPVAPLGTCSSMAPTDQHRVLSALRGTEVVSDPTNVLALASAERLKKAPAATIRFATSQRVVRAQEVPKEPGFAQHFRIFVLTTAGREHKDHGFTVGTVVDHVRTMSRALDRLEQHGYAFGQRSLDVLASPARASLGDRIAAELSELSTRRSVLEHPYYSGGLRYSLWVMDPDGQRVPLIDGGSFAWLEALTANRRHVFVASGMGAQLAAQRFRV